MDIAVEIARLREMDRAALIEKYEEVWGRPPRCKNKTHLWKRIAWRIQEQRYGGLSRAAKSKLEQLIAEIDLPLPESTRTVTGALRRPVRPGEPPLGTVLTRRWKGTDVRVVAVDGGWEHEGVVYRSLSAVAKAVTGSKWNGKLFFGLTQRSRSKR